MTYKITLKKSAQKELTKLDRKIAERILTHVYLLAGNPYPPNAKQLVGMEHSFRLRVGDWRVIYTVENEQLVIEIIRIGHRREVYRTK